MLLHSTATNPNKKAVDTPQSTYTTSIGAIGGLKLIFLIFNTVLKLIPMATKYSIRRAQVHRSIGKVKYILALVMW